MTEQALFVTEKDVAKMLGHDINWLRSNAKNLEEATGFPAIDPVVGKRHRESIIEWARERSQRRLSRGVGQLHRVTNQENKDAF